MILTILIRYKSWQSPEFILYYLFFCCCPRSFNFIVSLFLLLTVVCASYIMHINFTKFIFYHYTLTHSVYTGMCLKIFYLLRKIKNMLELEMCTTIFMYHTCMRIVAGRVFVQYFYIYGDTFAPPLLFIFISFMIFFSHSLEHLWHASFLFFANLFCLHRSRR